MCFSSQEYVKELTRTATLRSALRTRTFTFKAFAGRILIDLNYQKSDCVLCEKVRASMIRTVLFKPLRDSLHGLWRPLLLMTLSHSDISNWFSSHPSGCLVKTLISLRIPAVIPDSSLDTKRGSISHCFNDDNKPEETVLMSSRHFFLRWHIVGYGFSH